MPPRISDKGLIKIAHFTRGIDNMSRDISMERDQFGVTIAAREANNVDFDADGNASRRRGFTHVQNGWHHSLFAAPGWPFGLVVSNGTLCAVTGAGELTPLVTGFAPWGELTYAELGDRVFWSDGFRNGSVSIDATLSPMGVEIPEPPTASATPNGGLHEGNYFVALTYQRDNGEEGGAYEPVDVYVQEGGGILLDDIPQPIDTTINRVNVYVSTANGGAIVGGEVDEPVLYRSASLRVGVLSAIVGSNAQGKPLDTLFLEPVPAATTYRMFNGRLLFVRDNELGWSQAMRPTITSIGKNRQRLPGKIDMCEPITQDEAAGVWIAARSRTWFIAGQDPTAEGNEWAMRLKHPYGVVPGSACVAPAKAFNPEASGNVVYWLDTGGHFCTGSAGGVITRLAENRFNAGVAQKAATFFRERHGQRHMVTSVKGGIVDRFSMSDSMSIKVFRDGREIG